MAEQPSPPGGLPQYIVDGVPKQSDEDLRALQDWIDELLEYREDLSIDDLDVDENESIESVEGSSNGTVVIKKVSCGKEGCKCQRGELHGPYKYVVRRQEGDLKWEYKGVVTD